jgi:hypothetical protein
MRFMFMGYTPARKARERGTSIRCTFLRCTPKRYTLIRCIFYEIHVSISCTTDASCKVHFALLASAAQMGSHDGAILGLHRNYGESTIKLYYRCISTINISVDNR